MSRRRLCIYDVSLIIWAACRRRPADLFHCSRRPLSLTTCLQRRHATSSCRVYVLHGFEKLFAGRTSSISAGHGLAIGLCIHGRLPPSGPAETNLSRYVVRPPGSDGLLSVVNQNSPKSCSIPMNWLHAYGRYCLVCCKEHKLLTPAAAAAAAAFIFGAALLPVLYVLIGINNKSTGCTIILSSLNLLLSVRTYRCQE